MCLEVSHPLNIKPTHIPGCKNPETPHPSPSPLPPGGGAQKTSKHHHAAAVAATSLCALQLRPAEAASAPGLYRSSGTRNETGRLDWRTSGQLRRQAFLGGSSLVCSCPFVSSGLKLLLLLQRWSLSEHTHAWQSSGNTPVCSIKRQGLGTVGQDG